jgi:RNA polymerase sigma-70 factor, ECF subfamily
MTLAARERSLRLVRDGGSPVEPPASDRELVASFLLRSPGAAEALHDRVRPTIDRVVRRLLGPRDADVDDAVQTSLIEIVCSLDRFRGGCALPTWASTIAARVVYKSLRRRRLERRIFETDVFAAANVPAATNPARESRVRGALVRIRAHLAAMDDKKAWAFVLHDVCGYDTSEVSQIMDVSVNAVQQRLSRCRRELADKIKEDPELRDVILELGELS